MIAPQITAAYAARVVHVKTQVRRVVLSRWDSLGADRRDTDAAAFATAVTPIVQAGQRVNVASSRAYFAALAQDASGEELTPEELQAALDAGDEPQTSDFTQPFGHLWAALAAGTAFEAALAIGRNQADALAVSDLTEAALDGVRAMGGSRGITMYDREPTSGNPCDLCLEAADQGPYSSEEMDQVHNGCGCIAVPVFVEAENG